MSSHGHDEDEPASHGHEHGHEGGHEGGHGHEHGHDGGCCDGDHAHGHGHAEHAAAAATDAHEHGHASALGDAAAEAEAEPEMHWKYVALIYAAGSALFALFLALEKGFHVTQVQGFWLIFAFFPPCLAYAYRRHRQQQLQQPAKPKVD